MCGDSVASVVRSRSQATVSPRVLAVLLTILCYDTSRKRSGQLSTSVRASRKGVTPASRVKPDQVRHMNPASSPANSLNASGRSLTLPRAGDDFLQHAALDGLSSRHR